MKDFTCKTCGHEFDSDEADIISSSELILIGERYVEKEDDEIICPMCGSDECKYYLF